MDGLWSVNLVVLLCIYLYILVRMALLLVWPINSRLPPLISLFPSEHKLYILVSSQVFPERQGKWKATTQSREFLKSIKRYYSNAYTDGEKQDAINL